VRVAGDPVALAPRLRALAASLDVGLRLEEVRRLDESVWRVDIPMVVAASTIVGIVCLGLFLSALGIFSLMSVSIARGTREIGLRTALGASRLRLLGGVFRRALVLVGSGIAAGNLVLLFFVWLSDEAEIADVGRALLITSSVMLIVGLLACLEPARRALRIHPSDALKVA
jgi:ABC-type antimicrobial peptide transport system permease subunit